MLNFVRDRSDDDRGAALVSVLFIGVSLVLLVTVMAARSARQAVNTALETDYEQALSVAESGLDTSLLLMDADGGYTTGEVAPAFAARSEERSWVLSMADSVEASRVVSTPDGEFVVIKPQNSPVVYSVGYVPSRDDAARRVRVLRSELGSRTVPGGWLATNAVLVGGDLRLRGNPTVTTGRKVGIHANGYLEVSGSSFVGGCIGASDGASVGGAIVADSSCPTPGDQAEMVVPEVIPLELWGRSHFDMCEDGRVMAGPGHPTLGHTAGTRPCTGQVVGDAGTSTVAGWDFDGCCDPADGAEWSYSNDIPVDGVFYFEHATVRIGGKTGSSVDPWEATLLVSADGACESAIGGDVVISGSPTLVAHPDGGNLTVAAGRDLDISGNLTGVGIFAAHQQIEVTGNPELTEGSFLAEDACDAPDTSRIHSTAILGNARVSNSEAVSTPFFALTTVEMMVGWDEL